VKRCPPQAAQVLLFQFQLDELQVRRTRELGQAQDQSSGAFERVRRHSP